jgi:hypothetical protein
MTKMLELSVEEKRHIEERSVRKVTTESFGNSKTNLRLEF